MSKQSRHEGRVNLLARFCRAVHARDRVIPSLLHRLSDAHLAAVFSFVRPIETVVLKRVEKGFNRAIALIPVQWYLDAGLEPMPRAPAASMSADAASGGGTAADCDAAFKTLLEPRGLELHEDLDEGGYGTVFTVRARGHEEASDTYVVKQVDASDPETQEEWAIHQHLSRTVPDTVPILYDVVKCAPNQRLALMERMGDALSSVQLARSTLPPEDTKGMITYTIGSMLTYTTGEELKSIVALVQRVNFEGDVYNPDVYSTNILRRRDGRGWKMIDLGLALRWRDVTSIELLFDVMFAGPVPTAQRQRAAAEYVFAHRAWLGVHALFGNNGAFPPALAADFIPAEFLRELHACGVHFTDDLYVAQKLRTARRASPS